MVYKGFLTTTCHCLYLTLTFILRTWQVFAAGYLLFTDVVFIAHFCYMWYIYRPHPEGNVEIQYSKYEVKDHIQFLRATQ